MAWQHKALRHGGTFLRHVVPEVVKPIHSLWHQVVGFFFLVFAGVFALWTVRHYRNPDELLHVVVTGAVGLVLAGFGISSLLRARKISRS